MSAKLHNYRQNTKKFHQNHTITGQKKKKTCFTIKKTQKNLVVSKKVRTFAPAFKKQRLPPCFGEMVEWSITVVLKTTVPRGTGGSNPSLSAKPIKERSSHGLLSLFFTLFDYKNPRKFLPQI